MRILIIEDEKLAAGRLSKLIFEIEPHCEILEKLESIRASVKWFATHPFPDLIFMDVQLADGLCFEIFEKVKIEIPVIFTTAYNEYALKAFKVNSIDYLLKPIDSKELQDALQKYKRLKSQNQSIDFNIQHTAFQKVMERITKNYRQRYVIKIGEHLRTINCCEIALFFYSEKASFIRTSKGRDMGIDTSLDQLEAETDPEQFFRVNRQQMVSINFIKDIIAYSGNRLKIILQGSESDEIIVSREKVSDFKAWLEGGKRG